MSAILEMPKKVVEGLGTVNVLPELLLENGIRSAGVISDPAVIHLDWVGKVLARIEESGCSVRIYDRIYGEPDFESINRLCGSEALRGCGAVLAFGGGSVIDTAKLYCAMAVNPEFARSPENPALIEKKGLPLFAVPTTAGTGAEATPNAILYHRQKKQKMGIVSRKMIADTVILDGEMTAGLPKALAASTGFDALSHAMESFVSKKANPYSDMFALEAMRLIFKSLVPACRDNLADARQDMLLASFYAGVCLVTASTHVVHAMAYPLAEEYHVPHGKGIAALLVPGMEGIRKSAGERMEHIASHCLIKENGAGPKDGAGRLITVMRDIQQELGMDCGLAQFGVKAEDCGRMAEKALKNRRLFDNCPADLCLADVERIYRGMLS